jgi:hypothetical protein
MIPSAPLTFSLRQHTVEHRHDVANPTRTSPCPFTASNRRAMVDLTRTPASPHAPIKGEPPRLNSSHTSLPLFLLIILDLSPIHIES